MILLETGATPVTGSQIRSIAEVISFGVALLKRRGLLQGSEQVSVACRSKEPCKSQKRELSKGISSMQLPTGLPLYLVFTLTLPS